MLFSLKIKYLIDPTFTKVNRLFVLWFARTATGGHRDLFWHYYAQNVKIKDFNVLIDGKSFFDLPVKNEEEAYQKVMSDDRNNDYTTVNLLDFANFKHKRLYTLKICKKKNGTLLTANQKAAIHMEIQ